MALVSLPGAPSATDASSGGGYGAAPAARFTDATSGGGYGRSPVVARPAAAPTGYSYSAALRNDPILQPYLGGLRTQAGANTVGLGTTQSGLLGQYGEVPGAATLGFTPSQEARDLANATTQGGVSTVARENQAYGQQNAGDAAVAAARGLAHSGFVGQYLQQNLDTHNQNAYANLQALLGQLGTAQQGYLTQQQALQDKGYQATQDAYARQVAAIQAGLIGPNVPRSVTGLPARVGGVGQIAPRPTRRAIGSGTRGGTQYG